MPKPKLKAVRRSIRVSDLFRPGRVEAGAVLIPVTMIIHCIDPSSAPIVHYLDLCFWKHNLYLYFYFSLRLIILYLYIFFPIRSQTMKRRKRLRPHLPAQRRILTKVTHFVIHFTNQPRTKHLNSGFHTNRLNLFLVWVSFHILAGFPTNSGEMVYRCTNTRRVCVVL